jgi:hypothetical protein
MNTTQINILTADGRLSHRALAETTERRIARLERYIAEMRAFSWTETYKSAVAELIAHYEIAHTPERVAQLVMEAL